MLFLYCLLCTLDDVRAESNEEEKRSAASDSLDEMSNLCMNLVISGGSLCYSTPPSAPLLLCSG